MKIFRLLFIISLMMIATFSWAQIPRTLSYQGVFTDTLGTPLPDGEDIFSFALFDDSLGGQQLWTEQHTLLLKRGLISVVLGSKTPFPDSVKFDRSYWLTIACDRCGYMEPRIPLTAVGYSINSLRADTALYSLSAPTQVFVDSARIAGTVIDGAINTNKIVNGTIRREDVEPGFISPAADTALYALSTMQSSYADSTRIAGTIVDNAVNTDKIINGTIRREDVDPGFIAPYADTAFVSIAADTLWKKSGGNIYREAGSVGIGTATPDAPLTIQTRVGTEIHFASSGTNADMSADGQLNINGGTLALTTGSQYRMLINSSGKIGIGNISPQHLLDVSGSIRANDTVIASSFVYTAPETAYVSGSAWSIGRVLVPPDSLGYSTGVYNTSNNHVFYEIPLQLPDGVSLISVDVYGYDNNALEELVFDVSYQPLNIGGGYSVASSGSGVSFSSGNFVVTATPNPTLLIMNSAYAYTLQIWFRPVSPKTSIRYYSFRAAYTYDKPGAISHVTNRIAPMLEPTSAVAPNGSLRGAVQR